LVPNVALISLIFQQGHGYNGWYRSDDKVAWMKVLGAGSSNEVWTVEAGPYEGTVIEGLIEKALNKKNEGGNELVPLPGTIKGRNGQYISSTGELQRYLVSSSKKGLGTIHKIDYSLRFLGVKGCDEAAYKIQRTVRKKLLYAKHISPMRPVFGTVQGESGWYQNPATKLVGYCKCIPLTGISSESRQGLQCIYRIEAGPFEKRLIKHLIEDAKQISDLNHKLPLPGVISGSPGLYIDSKGGVARLLGHRSVSEAIDIMQLDDYARAIQRAWRKRILRVNAVCGELVPFFGTLMGESGWYQDSASGKVAWFAINQNWEMLVGPYQRNIVRDIKRKAHLENGLVALPDFEHEPWGYYMNASGNVQYCSRNLYVSFDSKPVVETAERIKAAIKLQLFVRHWNSRRNDMFGALGTEHGTSGWYSTYRSTTIAWFNTKEEENGSQNWEVAYGPIERSFITELMEKSKWKMNEGRDPEVLIPDRPDISIDHSGKLCFNIINDDDFFD
jgi:hypothetical protein